MELTEFQKKEIELLHERLSHERSVRARDYAADMADRMADALADLTGEYFGEHSSDNCPWERAVNKLEDMADEAHRRTPVESGVPMPDRPRGNKTARGAKYASALREMAEGDSFVIPATKLPTIYAACKRNGWKVQVRRIENTGDVRVWKRAATKE